MSQKGVLCPRKGCPAQEELSCPGRAAIPRKGCCASGRGVLSHDLSPRKGCCVPGRGARPGRDVVPRKGYCAPERGGRDLRDHLL